MTQPTPSPATDDEKKKMREKVEKLLAQSPHASEGTIMLGGTHDGLHCDRRLRAGRGRRARREARRSGRCRFHDRVSAEGRRLAHASRVLRVQRRAGRRVGVPEPRGPRPEARHHQRRRHDAVAAVHGHRQHGIVVRALRSRVRRSAAHRVFADVERGRAQEDALRRRRRRRARRVPARLAREAPSLELADLHRRRELRDDARRRARPTSSRSSASPFRG